MPFSTALRAPLAAALLRLRHLMPQQHPLPQQGQHRPPPLVQLLQQMQAAKGQREVLALSQLAALLPLGAQERTALVAQTLQALARVSRQSPRSSASRAQTVRSIRSRRRRR